MVITDGQAIHEGIKINSYYGEQESLRETVRGRTDKLSDTWSRSTVTYRCDGVHKCLRHVTFKNLGNGKTLQRKRPNN